jgi:hypothetical protein
MLDAPETFGLWLRHSLHAQYPVAEPIPEDLLSLVAALPQQD